jgi:dinuclear metal center YbgI/SA1388 family protein
MTLAEIDRWLNEFLDLDRFAGLDSSLNGLQVAGPDREVTRAAFAVDASLETFRRAADGGAQILVVHHGILWDRQSRITGSTWERVRLLIEKNLALYAAHLPLDAHAEVGNNAGIARALKLIDVQPFGMHRGAALGCKGRMPEARSLEEVVALLTVRQGEPVKTLPFGPPLVRTVGIISGAAPWGAAQAIAEGLDLYITGEPAHEIYHHCLEQRIHAIFAGHYHSESFGVQALALRCAQETGVQTTYLDVPTGL